jgi:Fe-S cluster biogenesis protein NfuA/nitrite reductase/ring-hydroxylating ferredoxin subunit
VERRIEDALDGVRPYLGSHGGDVTLLGVIDDVVRLQFTGSCKSCPSSAVTLELTVEDAVRAAAPEIASIEVVAAEAATSSSVIPAESLLSRVHQNGHGPTTWHAVPDLADLVSGEVGGFRVAGTTVLACRVGDELFAYQDRCGKCEGSLAGAALHRPMGAPIGHAVLRCPRCRAHFDVVHAGAGVDENADATVHLMPIPLLVRDGVLSIAVAAQPTEAGMA